MKRTSFLVGLFLMTMLLLFASVGWGQTCPGNLTAMNQWCGPYTVPMTACLSGTNETSCHNTGSLNVGFYSIHTSGSDGNPFSTISANGINNNFGSGTAGPDVVPNGSVGLNQYMLFANNYLQAYDKTTHKPIFVNTSTSTTAAPQAANSPWEPYLGNGYCGQETVNFNMVYDHVDSIWVLAGASAVHNNGGTNDGHRFMCIGTSATDNQYTCSSGTCTSYWNAYAFDLTGNVTPAIFLPYNNNTYDLADYPRWGTWNNAYYMSFDFINQGSNAGQIDGFAVCQLDQANIAAGKAANSATCYIRLPSPSAPPMIHTLLPADMESPLPASTNSQGPFFVATVNPGTDGSPCEISNSQCTSTSLAYWTWSGSTTGITTEQAPTTITVNSFTPGCYNITYPGSTVCVPQPGTTNAVDSVGDRLMSPFAYRYIKNCKEGDITYTSCEYMAVTQTINKGSNGNPPTGVRYYTLAAPTSPNTTPTLVYQGDIYDSSSGGLYYWMPSQAIDKDENVGYTFSVGNGSNSNYPSEYSDTLDNSNNLGTVKLIEAGGGSIIDGCNHHWGEYVSAAIDPSDDLTFWGVGEYLSENENNCHGVVAGQCSTSDYSGCVWKTEAFKCQKGQSGGLCP
jgi:hypothetical protein